MPTAVDGKLLLSEHVTFVRKIRCHYRNGMCTNIMYFNAQKAIYCNSCYSQFEAKLLPRDTC